jgi:hypothetical protein
MKCSHPQCSRGIGLVSYRRAFAGGRYCSKKCRDNYAMGRPAPSSSRRVTTYFEWLFLQPGSNALPRMVPAVSRARDTLVGKNYCKD